MAKILPVKVRQRYRARQESYAKWQEFIDWMQLHQSPRWVFRGHSQSWPLKPTVGRNADRFRPEIEAKLLGEFRRLARPYLTNAANMSAWDWIFVAQHHGLPTRLLDWSINPLVSAYFACQPSARGKRDGELVAVEPRLSGYISMEEQQDPLSIERTAFVYPSAVASRISAQRGLFSVHTEPTKAWRLPNQTSTFFIPANMKADFLRYLMGLGVDSHLLMADLDGLTSTLKWKFNLGIAFD